jgi:hypothetical protein
MTANTARPPRSLAEIDEAVLYTISELAPLLRVTPRTLRNYCIAKVFANAKNLRSKRWLVPGQDVLSLYTDLNLSN